jgi:hypothetical protein
MYLTHEATLRVPDGWLDQSMNVFRLPGKSGAKDTSLVVTRDHNTELEDPTEYAKGFLDLAGKQFNAFKLLAQGEASIDGQPAHIIDYTWRSGGAALLRQRQAFVRNGPMLIITLTAMASEFMQHDAVWVEFLSAFKLRKDEPSPEPVPQPPAANDEVAAPPTPAAAPDYFYALAIRQRALHVVPATTVLQKAFNAVDVEDGLWKFYAADGSPLRAQMIEPNRRGVFWSDPGTFELVRASDGHGALPLDRILTEVQEVKGPVPLNSVVGVRESLERLARKAP